MIAGVDSLLPVERLAVTSCPVSTFSKRCSSAMRNSGSHGTLPALVGLWVRRFQIRVGLSVKHTCNPSTLICVACSGLYFHSSLTRKAFLFIGAGSHLRDDYFSWAVVEHSEPETQTRTLNVRRQYQCNNFLWVDHANQISFMQIRIH